MATQTDLFSGAIRSISFEIIADATSSRPSPCMREVGFGVQQTESLVISNHLDLAASDVKFLQCPDESEALFFCNGVVFL